MKKYNSPWVVASIFFVLLLTSMVFNFKFITLANSQRRIISSLQSNKAMLNEYKEALRLSDAIMDNNDLWDRDGSDVMSDYLNLRANMDTTFYHGFHYDALLDNLANDINE